MSILIVVDDPKDWRLKLRGVEVAAARDYLGQPRYGEMRLAKVFNLCASYAYQSLGYYVSLLAQARGHKPLPSISTIQDLKLSAMLRLATHELEEPIARALGKLKGDRFVLSVYFGRNMANRYERLALALFNQFPAPLLRAEFRRDEDGWEIRSVRPIEADEIPDAHVPFVIQSAEQYFAKPARRARRAPAKYELAILSSDSERTPPSDGRALRRFIRAADSLGLDAEIIDKDDYGRIAEFDALFVRDTTAVNHYTFRFARRAVAEGLVVIDDPESIIKCANKVYLAELARHQNIPSPKTLIIDRANCGSALGTLGLPLVLKQPDSSFSLGVSKVSTLAEYGATLDRLFRVSDLLVAQEYVPTPFDWRVGILDRQPLWVCRYFMAHGHWQIYNKHHTTGDGFGDCDSCPVDAAPPEIVKTAIRVANLIGDGLYGVDMKEVNGRPLVVEINDNPNIESGVEDHVLGDELYLRIMRSFLRRLDSRGR